MRIQPNYQINYARYFTFRRDNIYNDTAILHKEKEIEDALQRKEDKIIKQAEARKEKLNLNDDPKAQKDEEQNIIHALNAVENKLIY